MNKLSQLSIMPTTTEPEVKVSTETSVCPPEYCVLCEMWGHTYNSIIPEAAYQRLMLELEGQVE